MTHFSNSYDSNYTIWFWIILNAVIGNMSFCSSRENNEHLERNATYVLMSLSVILCSSNMQFQPILWILPSQMLICDELV